MRPLAFLLPLLALGLVAEAATIRFAPLPMLPQDTLRGQFLPMLDYLERASGGDIEWVYHPDYQGVLGGLLNGTIDLAYLGPLPYVELTRQGGQVDPLVHFREASGSVSYDCALAVFGGDDELATTGVVGKRIGLTQPESTCGPFAVSVMLRRAGRALHGDGNAGEYAGSHSGVALGVVAGRYDVGGLKLGIARQYANLDLRVIDRVGPYPGFALVANVRTLPRPLRDALREALLRAPVGEFERWGGPIRHGVAPAADADYDGVRADLGLLAPAPAEP